MLEDILETLYQHLILVSKLGNLPFTSLLGFFSLKKGNGSKVKKKEKKYLPPMFLYFDWILCILAIIACSVTLVLYGMSFGNTTSWIWFVTIIISFFKDIFGVQPVKIFFISLVTSFVWKKIDLGDESDVQKKSRKKVIETLLFEGNNTKHFPEEKGRNCSKKDTQNHPHAIELEEEGNSNSSKYSRATSSNIEEVHLSRNPQYDESNKEINVLRNLSADSSSASDHVSVERNCSVPFLPSKADLNKARVKALRKQKLYNAGKELFILIVFVYLAIQVPFTCVDQTESTRKTLRLDGNDKNLGFINFDQVRSFKVALSTHLTKSVL